jgi:hypothetical protein
MAIENARDVYTRRMEGVSIWVVESKHVHASEPSEQEALFEPANDKIYKKCFVQSLSALLKKIDILGIYTTSFERNEISNSKHLPPIPGIILRLIGPERFIVEEIVKQTGVHITFCSETNFCFVSGLQEVLTNAWKCIEQVIKQAKEQQATSLAVKMENDETMAICDCADNKSIYSPLPDKTTKEAGIRPDPIRLHNTTIQS